MNPSRRSIVSALGLLLPVGLWNRLEASASAAPTSPTMSLRFRPFEESVRAAFEVSRELTESATCHRIEIGYSDDVEAGVQGCHNDRPFAGFAAGRLRIVRVSSQPGRIENGVRLYVTTVDVALSDNKTSAGPSRPFNFAKLPAAPVLS